MKTQLRTLLVGLALLSTLNPQLSTALAQGTAFTYQGRLTEGPDTATGLYDLSFSLFAASGGGAPVSGPLTTNGVAMANGLFTVTLDFGQNFPGADRFLEIAARTNGGGAFTTLSPRQKINATPYAITARNVTGVVPSASLAGSYSSAVTLNNAGNSFSGSGAGLTGVNAATLGGVNSSGYWRTTGNSGTTAANFLGTPDNQPLDLRVNNRRALRLQPNTNGAPTFIAGSSSNFVTANVPGASIGGGDQNIIQSFPFATSDYATIGGGSSNFIDSFSFNAVIGGGFQNTLLNNNYHSTIAGGFGNRINPLAPYATISGGRSNTVDSTALYSAVGGGDGNTVAYFAMSSVIDGGTGNNIRSNAQYSVIGGGTRNTIQTNAHYSIISGGQNNRIERGAENAAIAGGGGNSIHSDSSVIAGGRGNRIETNAPNSAIGGGDGNRILFGASQATIAGGLLNGIDTNAVAAFIGGGSNNEVGSNAMRATITGGSLNLIQASAEYSTISGGQLNTVAPGCSFGAISGGKANRIVNLADFATVPGGGSNVAGGHFSFAAGRQAQAMHHGSFVWSDFSETAPPFASTAENQFLIRAAGGVGIGTPSPQEPLHVMGDNVNLRLQNSVSGQYWSIFTQRHPTPSISGNLLFFPGTGVYGFIDKDDGIYYSSSDIRLKTDIRGLGGVLDRVMRLRPVSYRFKSASESVRPSIGLIAQEVEPLFPEAVGEHDGTKALAYSTLVPVTVGAIQELNRKLEQKLEQKEAEIAELKTRLEKLEQRVNQGHRGGQ